MRNTRANVARVSSFQTPNVAQISTMLSVPFLLCLGAFSWFEFGFERLTTWIFHVSFRVIKKKNQMPGSVFITQTPSHLTAILLATVRFVVLLSLMPFLLFYQPCFFLTPFLSESRRLCRRAPGRTPKARTGAPICILSWRMLLFFKSLKKYYFLYFKNLKLILTNSNLVKVIIARARAGARACVPVGGAMGFNSLRDELNDEEWTMAAFAQSTSMDDYIDERARNIGRTCKQRHEGKRKLLLAIKCELKKRDGLSERYFEHWWGKNKVEAYQLIKDEPDMDAAVRYWVEVFRWLSYEQGGGNGFNRSVTSIKHLINCEPQYKAAMRDKRRVLEGGRVKGCFATAVDGKKDDWNSDITTKHEHTENNSAEEDEEFWGNL